MDMEPIRDTIASALLECGLRVIPLGNTIHVIGSTDYEIVIKTMRPFEAGGIINSSNSGENDGGREPTAD